TILDLHETVGEVGGQSFVHPSFTVTVRADDVVPPLMTGCLSDEVIDERLGQVRHAEDARVDHDETGAFVAVPSEIRFDDGELRIRIGAEPARVDGQSLLGALDHETRVMLVFGSGEAAYLDVATLPGELAEAGAAHDGEIAHAARSKIHLTPTVAEVTLRQHRSRASDMLLHARRQTHREKSGLVVERLMPADIRRRLPALVIVESEDGQPVGQEGDALPVSPSA